MKKEELKKEKTSLVTICLVTSKAIEALGAIQEKETIVAIGDTGCGKSTILTALIYGVDDLEESKEGSKKVIKSKT